MLSVKENLIVDFSPSLLEKFGEIVARYPEGRQKSALLPILHEVQAAYGWLSVDAMDKVAHYLTIQPLKCTKSPLFIACTSCNHKANICWKFVVLAHVALLALRRLWSILSTN